MHNIPFPGHSSREVKSMEQPSPRPEPMYPGTLTDENIRKIFGEASDFTVRNLRCRAGIVRAYFLDGLTSGG